VESIRSAPIKRRLASRLALREIRAKRAPFKSLGQFPRAIPTKRVRSSTFSCGNPNWPSLLFPAAVESCRVASRTRIATISPPTASGGSLFSRANRAFLGRVTLLEESPTLPTPSNTSKTPFAQMRPRCNPFCRCRLYPRSCSARCSCVRLSFVLMSHNNARIFDARTCKMLKIWYSCPRMYRIITGSG